MAVWILLLPAIVQCVWWVYYFARVSGYKLPHPEPINPSPAVSIVICFKDLPESYETHLRDVISQEYEDFEVVLVDDFSSESSLAAMKKWLSHPDFEKVHLIRASLDIPGKKQAQRDGVAAAKNGIILFTDLDCRPAGPRWIQSMVGRMMAKNADVVLGYGPMDTKPGMIAWFAGFETVLTALQYFGFHLAGTPFMSVGRNWLVKKSVFLKYAGKARGHHLASGDDDLLLQAMKNNIIVSECLEKSSFMYSSPKTGFRDFLHQKKRHISTSIYYPVRVSAKLFVFAFSVTSYYGLVLISLWFAWIPMITLACITLAKWMIQTICHFRAFRLLEGKKYIILYPLAELGLALYYVILPIRAFFKKTNW
jgi:glycosyltransferase involved in cell wall biosynthesis